MTDYSQGHDPTAVMGRRIGAFIVDTVILYAIYGVVWRLTSDLTEAPSGIKDCVGFSSNTYGCAQVNNSVYLFKNTSLLYGSLATLAYVVVMFWVIQGITGATLGKALFGVRVVNDRGTGPGIGRAIIRSLLMIVDAFCFYLVGLVSAFTSKGHRRVGDMAARTFVVGSKDRGRPVVVPGLAAGAGAPAAAPAGATTAYPPGGYGTGYTPAPATMPTAPPTTGAPSTPPPSTPPTPGTPAGPPPGTPPGADAAGAAVVGGAAAAATTPTTPTTPATPAPPSAPSDQPQWDPQRNAYIQFDPSTQRWMQFDDAAQQWRPMS